MHHPCAQRRVRGRNAHLPERASAGMSRSRRSIVEGGDIVSSSSAAGATNRHPVFAALSLCGGVMIFSGQDWIIKLLSGDYPVHQAIAIRGVVAVVILL